jgi:hypothetical protein
MTNSRSRQRRVLVSSLLASAAVAGLGACASTGSDPSGGGDKPTTSTDPYRGPAITLDSTGPRHLIIVEAPSPGWTVSFDQVGQSGEDVHITITRPDPGLLYPAVIVEQRMDSTLPAGQPVRVLARVVDFGAKAGAYGLAVEGR